MKVRLPNASLPRFTLQDVQPPFLASKQGGTKLIRYIHSRITAPTCRPVNLASMRPELIGPPGPNQWDSKHIPFEAFHIQCVPCSITLVLTRQHARARQFDMQDVAHLLNHIIWEA
jgi:hypothetical protein